MGTISRQTTWATGDTLTASDLNGEFDNILSTANGSLNADNLGVTAGQAAASKAVVLDSNKDFADTSSGNQIRNLTISGSLKIGTTFLPDASGGADLGSTALEWGDVYIADDKKIYLGSDQNITLQYDETTNDALEIAAAVEGAALGIVLKSDQGDDAGDEWKLNIADGGTLTLGNDIASAGTYVTHLTLTPNSTVSSSTLALAGGLTVAGTASITGVATVGGITIGSAVINEAELETIDGITAGTVAASKAVVVDSNKDIGTFRNITIDGTFSDGNYTFDTSGNVSGLGTIGSGAITSTGVVTATGFTIGSAVINEAELETIDGVTAGTVAASKAVVVDSNKDIGSFRNVTLTGELDAATGDFSGDVDVDGTLEADAITLNGTALGSLYSPIAGSSSIVTVGTIGTGTWQGTAVASAYLDADTAHLSTTQTFSGAKTFSAAAQFSNTVTVGENGTGYDVQLFGDTAGSSVLWDQSADDLILTNAGLAVGSDATGDLYYRNSSGYLARLGVGSDGQVLTSTGTLPNWEAAAGGGHTIQEEGSSLTQRTNLNFVGAGVTATDDSGNNATKVTVTPTGASLPVTRSDGSTSDPIALTSAALGESLVSDTSPQLGGNLDVNGQSIVSASNGNIQITPNGTGSVLVGANDTGHDVKFFGATSGKYMEWDESADTLNVVGNAGVGIARTDGTLHVHTASAGSVTASVHYDDLVVESSGNTGISILAPEDSASGIAFGSDADNDVGYIYAQQSGTAGSRFMAFGVNAAERMRIDSSGNVGVGSNDPDSAAPTGSATPKILKIAGGTGIDKALQIQGYNDDHGLDLWTDVSTGDAYIDQRGDHDNYDMHFRTKTTGTPINAMTITGTGSVGIGTGSPSSKLHIDNSTSSVRTLAVRTSVTNEICMDVTQSSSGFANHVLHLQTANGGSSLTGFDFLNCHDSGSDKAWIRGDGTYGSATNSYGSTSDSKIKQDIVDARKDYWDDFKQVRFRKFRLKDQVAIDSDAPSLLGVVAQEIESIFPSLVTESPDQESKEVAQADDDGNPLYVQSEELDEDGKTTNKLDAEGNPIPLTEMQSVNLGTTTKVVKYSILNQIGLCVVQELQTRLEAAEAKIAALEAA